MWGVSGVWPTGGDAVMFRYDVVWSVMVAVFAINGLRKRVPKYNLGTRNFQIR